MRNKTKIKQLNERMTNLELPNQRLVWELEGFVNSVREVIKENRNRSGKLEVEFCEDNREWRIGATQSYQMLNSNLVGTFEVWDTFDWETPVEELVEAANRLEDEAKERQVEWAKHRMSQQILTDLENQN